MKLFSVFCKRGVCLSLALIIASMGIYNTNSAAEVSEKYDTKLGATKLLSVECSPSKITLIGYVSADVNVKPTGVEIYRAKLKANGTRENFITIGTCKKLEKDANIETGWHYTYIDNTVKTGQAYVYRCRAYREDGTVRKFSESQGETREAIAAKEAGSYKCKVIKNTSKKLVIKITGKSKNNGLLEYNDKQAQFFRHTVVFKNKGKEGGMYNDLKLAACSYNGKKWYKKPKFAIKGKESIYLRFNRSGHDIKVSGYKYVQMMLQYMRYNLHPWSESEMPQMRVNLTTGEAVTGRFIKQVNSEWVTEWDGDIFKDNIPWEYVR